ncbi:hypothetical protein Ddye_009390 [Dipteronia dyeriana]|uniref:Uncharacterized protein n=1 Tax=Dipteronia dyeriana TaxID=168575 RepID=A0AAE0CMU5_9ROSI|nr:hypothetical protein Ddye_009390 [Dipteronia dyeriana]
MIRIKQMWTYMEIDMMITVAVGASGGLINLWNDEDFTVEACITNSRNLSDHNPILLGDSGLNWGPVPFCFLNWYLGEKEMMKEAMKRWSSCEVKGSKGFVLFSKIRASKVNLKEWIRASKMNFTQPKDVDDRLGFIDFKTTVERWSETLKQERLKLLEELWKSLRKEEQEWRQKSRINWLFEGDKNTKFFYSVANGRGEEI